MVQTRWNPWAERGMKTQILIPNQEAGSNWQLLIKKKISFLQ